ncbi:MAG: linear amide C-N hydrolase [Sulfurospirillum sp.]|nr:linear amide C-N hydrolase [Sulfurospirillum sp.]
MKLKIYILLLIVLSNVSLASTIFDTKNSKNEILVGSNFSYSEEGGQINFIPAKNSSNSIVTISLDNPNMSYEGMNDKGLFIAISTVPNTSTPINIIKPIKKSFEMVEIVLKTSSNIDDALNQFKKYSITFGKFAHNSLVHFKIVQKDGQSVIVEFVNNKMVIIEENSKIMTNHYISDSTIKSDSETSHQRYKTVMSYQNKINSIENVFKVLDKTKDANTLWSNIYNLTTEEIYIKYKDNSINKLNLKDELYAKNEAFFYKLDDFSKENKLDDTSFAIQIRPHFGYGSEETEHYGLRVLLKSNENQAFGLELTEFKNGSDEFQAIGILLEQRLWNWFNMSIGTVGYFNYGLNNQNPTGLMTNLGWEPNNSTPLKPFITYRGDTIFAKEETKNLHSISIGFKLEFF